MYAERKSLTLTTDSSGNATGYIDVPHGALKSTSYLKAAGGAAFADTVDFAITVEGTGEGIWTEANVTTSATRRPRAATHGVDGVAALYAGSGSPVLDDIYIANDRIKFVITNGGDSKTGTFNVIIG